MDLPVLSIPTITIPVYIYPFTAFAFSMISSIRWKAKELTRLMVLTEMLICLLLLTRK